MLKVVKLTCFAGLLVLSPAAALLAKDFATYRLGDIAVESITAPVAFDVGDYQAPKAPAVFRSYSTTNAIARKFLAEFAGARANFIAAVQDEFHQPTLDEQSIASSDFGYLVTAFNMGHKAFPVTGELAADWARGKSGLKAQSKLLDSLLKAAQRLIRPDMLPDDFATSGETCCLVPASSPGQELTVRDIERGELVAQSSIGTLSDVRELFRHEFSTGEQPLARAVSQLLDPNCIPDPELTHLARNQVSAQSNPAKHYAAGQLIVQRGAKIDAPIMAALAALQKMPEKSASHSLSQPATGDGLNSEASEQPTDWPGNNSIQSSQTATSVTSDAGVKTHKRPLKIPGPLTWILGTVSVVSATASMILLRKRKLNPPPVRAIKYSPQTPVMLQPELAPIVQAVKETFIQELALQRRELILAQQQAAAEIVELIRRLDKLQVPMQERLKAYELEIQRLEKELAERTEENRELLKLRIELTRQQLEIERAGDRAKFN